MQETNEMRGRLINEFVENYMEKLFYFCSKKTGTHIEAEDLTQNIALQIITALNKGTIPTSFSASGEAFFFLNYSNPFTAVLKVRISR